MGWTVYNSDGQILQGSSTLADDSVTSAKIVDGAIVNADVNASAAIAFSKMADLTASRALVSDGNGDVSVSAVTSTEIGYLDGVTSAIQTQLNAAGGAVTREGGNLTEATTTSTSVVDILAIASLSILAIEPGRVIFAGRKTSGAVADGSVGVKINSTVISVPATSSTTHFAWGSADTNVAMDGPGGFHIAPRVTNYLNSSAGTGVCGYAPVGGGQSSTMTGVQMNDDSGYPNAEITSITLQAIVQSSSPSITLGVDELHAYSLVAS